MFQIDCKHEIDTNLASKCSSDMKFEFNEKKPNEFKGKVILLSGEETRRMDKSVYLTIENDLNCYEIRYPFICGPFKKAIKIGSMLAVGYQSFFYLFNIDLSKNLLNFEIGGYFGDIYVDQNLLYVAGAMGLYCFSLDGILVWENTNLGVDGILIDHFTPDKIYGSAEHDPPEGWKDFIVDKGTGRSI